MDILVIEDDLLMSDTLCALLQTQAWQVRAAHNGRAGLNLLFERKPDLILLDLMMPVMDGFEFLDVLRAQAAWQNIPVIVLTAMELTKREHERLDGRIQRLHEKGKSTFLEALIPDIEQITAAQAG